MLLVDLDHVASTGDLRVSSRGQMSLPAAARARWELADGGKLGYLDLGDALLLVPGGVDALRRRLLDAISEEDWGAAASGFGDPDLADG
jgi:bifunctional DNA-binding transcriptional regulator/antitoxin component of YhaV-PrlF toxin-antitoxin module